MKERPILFRGDMVRAILEGRKTQTRKMIKGRPFSELNPFNFSHEIGDIGLYVSLPCRLVDSRGRNKSAAGELVPVTLKCPYGQPGDRLWVRETFGIVHPTRATPDGKPYDPWAVYKSDEKHDFEIFDFSGWKPSIHMPRWASRITLEITNVRVERIQEISEWDAQKEGIEGGSASSLDPDCVRSARAVFENNWNKTYPGSWDRNDWVWVIEFKRVTP